jgi:hypothetical protein
VTSSSAATRRSPTTLSRCSAGFAGGDEARPARVLRRRGVPAAALPRDLPEKLAGCATPRRR